MTSPVGRATRTAPRGDPLEPIMGTILKRNKAMSGNDKEAGYSTKVGFTNPNNQRVVCKTDLDGNDNLQKIYILVCGKCKHVYGSNGSNNHERDCPKCGKEGTIDGLDLWDVLERQIGTNE